MKAEVDKLDINKLVIVPTSLNNLKTKVHDLDVGKLKTFPVDLKIISDVVDNKVVKNKKLSTFSVNNLERKIPDATTLFQVNQINTDKQNLQKKIVTVDKKHQVQVVLWLQLYWIQKLVKLRIKFVIMLKILLLKKKLTAEILAAKLTQINLVIKADFDNKLTNFNKRITWKETKELEDQKKINSLIKNITIFS